MTPTEQDKELDKILDVLIDSVVEARMKWHKQSQRARQERHDNSGFTQYQSELNYADNTAKSAIKKLITADRKRVALEARIDENEAWYALGRMIDPREFVAEIGRLELKKQELVAELKAQQEEV